MRWAPARSQDGEIVGVVAGRRARGRAGPALLSSKAVLSLKSRSASLPNSLNGMMSVTSLRWGGDQRWRDAERRSLQQETRAGICWVNLICPSSRNHNVIWTLRR